MKKLLVAALMMAATAVGIGNIGFAMEKTENRVDPINPVTEYVTYEVDESSLDETMEDYVKGLDMLTSKEKEQLIKEDKALQPYYQENARLSIAIEEKTNEILEGAEKYFDERGDIQLGKNSKLWDKLWDNLSAQQEELEDYKEIIKASKALSQSEKEMLLKEQERLDELEKEIDKYYDRAEEATKELTREWEENQKKIREIKKESEHIWKKVYKEEITY